jgi:hypothetical protein
MQTNQRDITLEDVKLLLGTLDEYDRLLAYAKKNWKKMSTEQKLQFHFAFSKIAAISKEFEEV